ncbi:MAG: nucleotidyltransferase domain-containing protein [Candidatus Thermoplasmatota archaeon]|nr:nucleotidyltransferase domain-containing protein [Candidatus Thermoplasmatota archaeon]
MIDQKAAKLLLTLEKGTQRFGTLQQVVPNPRTLSSKLKGLVQLGLVEKRGGLYRLNDRGEKALFHVRELQEIISPLPPISVEKIPHPAFRAYVRRFCEKLLEWHGDNLIGLLLFGSVARGDWDKDSDIDLLIVLRKLQKSKRDTLREVIELRRELRGSQEYKDCVSMGYYPTVEAYPLEMEEAKRFRRMYLDALTEGIVIFERESFLTELIGRFEERLRDIGARRIEIPSVGHYWVLGDIKAGEVIEL